MAGHGSSVGDMAAAGPGLWRDSPLGRIAVPLFIFMLLTGIFTVREWPYPLLIALGITAVFEALVFFYARKRRRRLTQKATDLQAQLHDLKQQEFALRYEEAKQNGQLDQFEGEK